MLVLRKDVQEGIRRCALADALERDAGLSLAGDPEIPPGRTMASRDDRIGEIELAIKLERARLHGKGARGGAGTGGLVDDAHLCAGFG